MSKILSIMCILLIFSPILTLNSPKEIGLYLLGVVIYFIISVLIYIVLERYGKKK